MDSVNVRRLLLLVVCLSVGVCRAASILIPMDEKQANHLKAYGIAYKTLKDGMEVEWLLNYRGGSFLIKSHPSVETECRVRGVSFETLSDSRGRRYSTADFKSRRQHGRRKAPQSG